MRQAVIIVAGGSGTRMGGDIPKQFLPIKGVPVLIHTILAFRRAMPNLEVVLVLPKLSHDFWDKILVDILDELGPDKHLLNDICVAEGGENRFSSVKNGLAKLVHFSDDDFIAIHDGVRPFVSAEVIHRCFQIVVDTKAVVPVVPVVDSLRRLIGNDVSSMNQTTIISDSQSIIRAEYVSVQTPQVFGVSVLRHAYLQAFDSRFTDDASVVEAAGTKVSLVLGNEENIKLTTQKDMYLAELLTP